VTKQNSTTGEIFVRINPATTLENLANVKDQPPQVGQVLVYDGSVWAGTTQATYSSIGIPGASPPPGGFKSVWFQDSAGNMTYDLDFTYDTSVNTLNVNGSITLTGTVDGVDVSALKTTVDGLSSATDTSNFWAFYLAD